MTRPKTYSIPENKQKPIPLFWWSEIKFIFKDKENYGDLLGKYLVEKISGRPVKFVQPKKQAWYTFNKLNYLTVGSIIHHATKNSIVWGSGIIDWVQEVAPADFRAVRGPRTREHLISLGYECPEVYGDPALLLPQYYNPNVEKSHKIGIIPHYHDYEEVSQDYADVPEIMVIDLMTLDVEEVTLQIMSCENVISSSLHGLIVAHTYGIPAVWVEFSKKLFGDGVKFADYLESAGLPVYTPKYVDRKFSSEEFIKLIGSFPAIPDESRLNELKTKLLSNCPFV